MYRKCLSTKHHQSLFFAMDNHRDRNPTIIHPTGIIVPVVGFLSPDHGHYCAECNPFGVVVEEDVVLRVTKEQILTLQREQAVICMYSVTG